MSALDIAIVAVVVLLFGLALWKTVRGLRRGQCTGCSSSACDCCDKCKEKSK